jgi:hypothetical protein
MWSNYKIIEVGGFQTKAGDGSDRHMTQKIDFLTPINPLSIKNNETHLHYDVNLTNNSLLFKNELFETSNFYF